MPKAQHRKRIRTARAEAEPISKPAKPAKSAPRDAEVQALITKLQSSSADDRIWAVSTVSHIISNGDHSIRRTLQSKKLVDILIQRLADEHSEIQVEAVGALRNLAIEGSFEVCAEIFNKNAVPALSKQLEPLRAALQNHLDGKAAQSDEESKLRKLLWTWLENVATLFCCIAESSDKAYKAVVGIEGLSNLLYSVILSAQPYKDAIPASAAAAAAQAVYVLTDATVATAPKFPLPKDVSRSAAYKNAKEALRSKLQSSNTQQSGTGEAAENWNLYSVLTIGILQNLANQQQFGKQRANVQEMQGDASLYLQVLVHAVSGQDLSQTAREIREQHTKLGEQTVKAISGAADLLPERQQLQLADLKLTRMRLSLEILAELVAQLDGVVDLDAESEEFEEWNGIANGHGDDAEMDGDDAAAASSSQTQAPLPLSAAIAQAFAVLPQILLDCAQPTSIAFADSKNVPANVGPSLIATQPTSSSPHAAFYIPNFTEQISLLHTRSLECLNNMLITLARSTLAEPAEDAQEDGTQMPDERLDEQALAMMDSDDIDNQAAKSDDDATVQNEPVSASPLARYIDSHASDLQKLWEQLFDLLVRWATIAASQADNKKSLMAEVLQSGVAAISGSAWSIARVLGGKLTVGQDESKLLIQLLEASLVRDAIAETCAPIVGVLGALAVRPSVSTEENKAIGNAIMAAIGSLQDASTPDKIFDAAEILAQALDSIFEIYGDEARAYDTPVFVQQQYLSRLETLLPKYKQMVKGLDKRKFAAVRSIADGALENLQAFVKYRKSLKL